MFYLILKIFLQALNVPCLCSAVTYLAKLKYYVVNKYRILCYDYLEGERNGPLQKKVLAKYLIKLV